MNFTEKVEKRIPLAVEPEKPIIEKAEEELDKLVKVLEQFGEQVKKSRMNQKFLIAMLAKMLKMKQRDLQNLIHAVNSGSLRRQLFKG